jgi:hypothetical protein
MVCLGEYHFWRVGDGVVLNEAGAAECYLTDARPLAGNRIEEGLFGTVIKKSTLTPWIGLLPLDRSKLVEAYPLVASASTFISFLS